MKNKIGGDRNPIGLKCFISWILFGMLISSSWAQQDSLKVIDLQEITMRTLSPIRILQPLDHINKTFIVGGRKSEVIQLTQIPGNISEKTGRQIFAKIPSAFVYDMDGSGNQ